MADIAEDPRSSPAPMERRQHARAKIHDVSYVELLEGQNGGLLLDISETGFLLQSALEVTDAELSRLRFRLPASEQWIEARARLVWVGASGKKAGAQFLELSEGARAGIAEWVGNGARLMSVAEIAATRDSSRPTVQEPPAPAQVTEANSANDPAASGAGRRQVETATAATTRVPAQENRDSRPLSYEQPGRDSTLPWWGLGKVVCWIAIAAVAAFLGVRYSVQLERLPIFSHWTQARNSSVSRAKAVQSPSANAATPRAPGLPKAQLSGLPPNPLEKGAANPSSADDQSDSAASAPKDTGATFGNMVTQTLSPDGTATTSSATGSRTQAQTQRPAPSGAQSSGTPSPAHAGAPEPSHDAILVGAPAVGAPPVRMILESEPVSASSRVAITARRSILVRGSYDRTEQLRLGKLVFHANPVYPAEALEKEIEGTVRVRAFIGPSGQVLSVRLLSGPAALAPAAMNAIREWRYGATLLNGQAIESQADVTIFFRLH